MAQGLINGKDFLTVFGLEVSDGLKNLEDASEAKQADTYDYPEFNGLKYSSAPIKLQDRDVTLSCFIRGSSIADVVQKKDLLLAELTKPGFQNLYSYLTNKTYSVRYKATTPLEWYNSGNTRTILFKLTLIRCFNEFDTITTTILDGNG